MDFLQDLMVLTAFSAILAKLAVTGPPAQIFQRQQLHQFLADLNDPSIQILNIAHLISKHNGLFARIHKQQLLLKLKQLVWESSGRAAPVDMGEHLNPGKPWADPNILGIWVGLRA